MELCFSFGYVVGGLFRARQFSFFVLFFFWLGGGNAHGSVAVDNFAESEGRWCGFLRQVGGREEIGVFRR